VKAKHEKAEKIEAAQKREVAQKGMAAERASKHTEKKAKEAQMKMEKSAKINEKATKEASQKNTEKEEKLFNSERRGKEASTKKASEIAAKTTIVPVVPPPPPIIPVTPGPAPVITPVPAPPAPAPPALQYACDVKNCQCVVASNGPYNELPYCNEMCASVPACAPVFQPPPPPPPLVIPKELLPTPPPPPPVGSARLVPIPIIPIRAPAVHIPNEAEVSEKSLASMKEKLIKSRERFTKSQNELSLKNQKSAAELESKEMKSKSIESSSKEKESKEAKSKIKPVIVKQKVFKVKTHSVEWDIERGVKQIVSLKEKLVKAKAAGRIAINEQYNKHKIMPVKHDNCAVTHQICGEIHAASIQNLAKAGRLFDKTAAQLEANCAKTAAFEEKESEALKFAVCEAAADKMKELLHRIGSGYIKKTVIIGNTTLY